MPKIKLKHRLSDDTVKAVLAASSELRVIEQTQCSMTVLLPTADWLVFGFRLIHQPIENLAFKRAEVTENKPVVWVTFFNPNSKVR